MVFENPKKRDFLRFLPCFIRFLELWLGLVLGLGSGLGFGDSGYGDLEFGDLKFGELKFGEMKRNRRNSIVHTSRSYNRVQICETGNGKKRTATTTATVQYAPIRRWHRW